MFDFEYKKIQSMCLSKNNTSEFDNQTILNLRSSLIPNSTIALIIIIVLKHLILINLLYHHKPNLLKVYLSFYENSFDSNFQLIQNNLTTP